MEKIFVPGNKGWLVTSVSLFVSVFLVLGTFMEYQIVNLKHLEKEAVVLERTIETNNTDEIAGVKL